MPLKLISVNIERSMHLDLVAPFFASSEADIVCVQELMEADVPRLARSLGGAPCRYEPMGRRAGKDEDGIMGIGIFSKIPAIATGAAYYVGEKGRILDSDSDNAATFNAFNRMALYIDIAHEGSTHRIVTTHFTWTPDGLPNDEQRRDAASLVRALDQLGEFVLCGDFNAPRGGEIFSMLARKYTDNVPQDVSWSLDLDIHRVGNGTLQDHAHEAGLDGLMVDGLFTTPTYRASNVALVSGVSDHMAIRADIQKVQ